VVDTAVKKKVQKSARLLETASLSALDLFKDLPASCLDSLVNDSKVENFGAGHDFFQPGHKGWALFFLEKGRVQTFRMSGEKKLIIADLKPPAVFGEMGCVGPCTYYCYAQTTEPSRVRTVAKDQIEVLLRKYPSIARRLLDLVSERFVNVLLDLDATAFRSLIPRLANLLLERAKGDAVKGVTHKEIAERLRVYRESTTVALGELRKAGIIAIDRKQIHILDRTRLERASRE